MVFLSTAARRLSPALVLVCGKVASRFSTSPANSTISAYSASLMTFPPATAPA
jgi:hypothetical protein